MTSWSGTINNFLQLIDGKFVTKESRALINEEMGRIAVTLPSAASIHVVIGVHPQTSADVVEAWDCSLLGNHIGCCRMDRTANLRETFLLEEHRPRRKWHRSCKSFGRRAEYWNTFRAANFRGWCGCMIIRYQEQRERCVISHGREILSRVWIRANCCWILCCDVFRNARPEGFLFIATRIERLSRHGGHYNLPELAHFTGIYLLRLLVVFYKFIHSCKRSCTRIEELF